MLCAASLERLLIVHKVGYLHLGGLTSCIVKEVRSVRYSPRSQSIVTGKLVNGTVLEQRE